MLRLLGFLCPLIALFLYACQEPVKGCMNPRAQNFAPEADVNLNCIYYPLQVQMEHYTSALPGDSLLPGNWLVDVDGEFFYLENCHLMGNRIHLKKIGEQEFTIAPETRVFYKLSGGVVELEDNFFTINLGDPAANAGGWFTLGDFDELRFSLGTGDFLPLINPSEIAPQTDNSPHPLSPNTDAYAHLFDSTTMRYATLQLTAVQPNNNNRRLEAAVFQSYDFAVPYNVTVVDGQAVPIRIRLDYDALFRGISWTNDSLVLGTKLSQNLANAISTY